jgi:broad specificity phosphatase PhoE
LRNVTIHEFGDRDRRRLDAHAAILVTHDAIVRVALLDIAQRSLTDFWSMRVENAAYAVVDVDGARWSLAEESVNGHLAERRAATESQAL